MPPDRPEGPPADPPAPEQDAPLQELRDILLLEDRQYLTGAVTSVLAEATARRVEDSPEPMASALAPVLGPTIRRQIKENPADVIDALYPIIGQVIQRSVAEAMRALAQRVDARLRTTFSFRRLARRARASLTGVSEADLVLREALPCQVQQVFLVHRPSGLLLAHVSREPGEAAGSDIVGAMLSAIRDFVQDAFRAGEEGELDHIQYGDLSILVEPGPHAFLAVVLEGFEPEDLRHRMRNALSAVHRTFAAVLEGYRGDSDRLYGVEAELRPLLASQEPAPAVPGRARTPRLALAAAGGVLLLCLAAACAGAWWLAWGRPSPTSTPTASATPTLVPTQTPTVTASPTPTFTSTATRQPSSTPSPQPSSTPTATFAPQPTATATPQPVVGVMLGRVWLRAEPRDASSLMRLWVDQGRPVEVLAVDGTWYLIRWPPGDRSATAGWVPGRWVGLISAVPPSLITPGP